MATTAQASEGVYYLSLSVENVRCFAQEQTLDLSDGNGRPAQWTVILGDNGVGKTTLLEILAAGVGEHGIVYISSLRRIDAGQSSILAILARNSVLAAKHKDFSKHEYKMLFGEKYSSDAVLMKKFFYHANRSIRKSSLFLFGNDPAYEFLNGQGELINAEEWLLQTDYIANKPSEIQASYRQRLGSIKEILVKLLPEIMEIRISEPSKNQPSPRVEFKTPDGWLSLDQLSLGYQTMTAWMVDLAARLFDEYPDSPNPIAEPAVVLIDEIDLHLHPKWQRTIMAYLSERFINTQFIVTAHSPLIVQAAEQANIVVLKRGEQGVTIHQHPKDIQGWRVDQLLTSDLFDLGSARSPHYEALLAERQKILAKPHLSAEDQARLKALAAEIGDLPTAETAEDIDAMAIIRRAAQLLKTAS